MLRLFLLCLVTAGAVVGQDWCQCTTRIFTTAGCTGAPADEPPRSRTLDGRCVNDPVRGVSWKVGGACGKVDFWRNANCDDGGAAATATIANAADANSCQALSLPSGSTIYYRTVCGKQTCDKAAAQRCWSRYLARQAIKDPSPQRLQNMVYCYTRSGCKDDVQKACKYGMDFGYPIKCSDPKIWVEGIGGNTHSFFIGNGTQFVMVDFGLDDADADARIARIEKLQQQGKKFKGSLLTHGKPDNLMGAYKIKDKWPNAPLYAASNAVKQEAIHNLYKWRGSTYYPNSRGNPIGNAPNKFDYQSGITVMRSPYDLWGDWDVRVIPDMFEIGESRHFSMINIPSQDAWIVGDAVFSYSHPSFEGVDLFASCDWLSTLTKLRSMVDDDTTIWTGRGASGFYAKKKAADILDSNIDYITFARQTFARECNVANAINAITNRFQNWGGASVLQSSVAERVPATATGLGCQCPSGCANQPIPSCDV